MFKSSFNCLSEIIKNVTKRNITVDEILNILNLQGFEVKQVQNFCDDVIIKIEVKANRPDLLCDNGIAREIISYLELKYDEFEGFDFNEKKFFVNNDLFPLKIKIKDGTISRFCGIIVKNIKNLCDTPDLIKKRLEIEGINSINPVVDIQNYIMLKYGQPAHIYDLEKISERCLYVERAKSDEEFLDLMCKNLKIKKNDIIIKDAQSTVCIAGIIGSKKVETKNDTKNIFIECASFESSSVRVSSRRLGISTASSFRFERGVSPYRSLKICNLIAKEIQKICGGEIFDSFYDYFPEKKIRIINLRIKRCNLVLGMNLSKDEIIKFLEKFDFECNNLDDDNVIRVFVPEFRVDISIEEDLIEEVARSIGYDNIKDEMPIFRSDYKENLELDNNESVRKILVGLGMNEVITYSFIPYNFFEIFNINKGDKLYSDVIIQNPISPSYSLMRTSMAYSLVNSISFNYSVGNQDLALFEFGRVYFNNKNMDTLCEEIDNVSMIMSGTRIEKGFGIDKNIKYSFYDLVDYINILLSEFDVKFEINKIYNSFFLENNGYEIKINNESVGIFGEIDKDKFLKIIPNVKLLKDPIYFFEIYMKSISKKVKKLKFESKFPSIIRQYNFLVPENVVAIDIINKILNSSKFILKCLVKDIYENNKEDVNYSSLLFEVIYRTSDRTLTLEEVENSENMFLNSLSNDLNVKIKL